MSRTPVMALMVLVFTAVSSPGQNVTLFKSRELEVRQQSIPFLPGLRSNSLYEHRVYFGLNYLKPKNKDWHNDPEKDLSRLATTYWHQRGPLGVVMQKFNWFPGPVNTYGADARLPASLAGLALAGVSHGGLPVEAIVGAWSEPAIGRVGMEAGTVASYARPFTHLDVFEAQAAVLEFSLGHGKDQKKYFHFVEGAQERGAVVRTFQGDPRKTLAGTAPRGFYHILVVEPYKSGVEVMHEDLMTREGVAMLMELLAHDGILCIHISSRHFELSPIYADIAVSLKLACMRARDSAPDADWSRPETLEGLGHFTSEWVMLARDPALFKGLQPPPGYDKAVEKKLDEILRGRDAPQYRKDYLKRSQFWSQPKATGKYLWTDEGPRSFKGLYRSDPVVQRYRQTLWDTEALLHNRFGISNRYFSRFAENLLTEVDRMVTSSKNGGVAPDWAD